MYIGTIKKNHKKNFGGLTNLSPWTVICFLRLARSLNILAHDSKWHLKILGWAGAPNLDPLRLPANRTRLPNPCSPPPSTESLIFLRLIICKVRRTRPIFVATLNSCGSISSFFAFYKLNKLNYLILLISILVRVNNQSGVLLNFESGLKSSRVLTVSHPYAGSESRLTIAFFRI